MAQAMFGMWCCVLIPLSVFGQDPRQEEAKSLFKEGIERISKEDYEGALEKFRESHTRHPKPIALYNMGMCQMALSRHPEALLLFSAYLEKAGDNPIPDMRKMARDASEKLKGLVVHLDVKGAPEGAALIVDDRDAVALPLKAPIPVTPGAHHLVIEAPGTRPFDTVVSGVAGERLVVKAVLDTVRATLGVICDNRFDASVFIDGESVGRCPFNGTVEPGPHTVRVASSNRVPFEKTISVGPGERVSVTASFEAIVQEKTNPPPFLAPGGGPPSTTPADTQPRLSSRRIGAIATGALALGFGAMGLTFHLVGIKHNREKESIEEEWATRQSLEEKSRYDTLVDKKIPRDLALSVVGYSAALILMGTSLTFLIVDVRKQRSNGRAVEMSAHGLTLTF